VSAKLLLISYSSVKNLWVEFYKKKDVKILQ
jgi:hypothetical protein